MPGYGHKIPQAMCSSWIYYVFLTARASLTFRFLPPLEKVYVAIAFAAVMKATLAGELCATQEARCIQLLVSNLVAFSLSSNYSTLSSLLEWGDKNFLTAWLPRLFTPIIYSQLLFMNKMASPYYAEYGFYCGVWVSLPITSDDEPFSSAPQRPHSHQSSFRSFSYRSLRSSLPSFEALRCLGKPMQVSQWITQKWEENLSVPSMPESQCQPGLRGWACSFIPLYRQRNLHLEEQQMFP